MKDKKTRKPKKISWDISEDEFTSLVKKTPQMHHKTGFLLAWGSGLRLQEVLDLKEHCINFEKGTLKVIQGKNSKDRYTVIPHGFTKEHLKYLPLPLGRRSLQKAFETYATKSGLMKKKPGVHFHSLRHGFATHWINQGLPIAQLQNALGHADLGTTSEYLHMAIENTVKSYQEGF